MNVFDLSAKLTLDTSEYTKSLSDAEQETEKKSSGLGSKLASGVGKVAKVGAAAVATAFTAAATGVSVLTKQAVDNFSEYEQLVGGVETLFKDSAGTVQEYAANAYKTAGLSANEYMETVTSFSASLLQSLGGDTEQAAQMADLAITDMSDNANKMGTDMEAIQNAYQGFAKQNFTMLDNLKLGYGGTKEEMQRLIDDANKLREAQGLNADLTIDSYADIVEAIHTVQTEMGITGTTAQEASTTIQGSIGQMKSAWQNLLTGLGDPGADLDKLIDNMISTAETALENLAPVIETALTSIGTAIEKLAPIIAERLPSIIESVLPALINAAGALVNGLVAALPTIIQVLVDVLPDIIIQLSTAIIDNLPALLEAVWELIKGVLEALWQVAVQLAEIGWEWILNLTQGIRDKISDTVQAGQELWQNFKDNLHEKISEALQQGVEWIVNLIQGIRDKIADTVAAGAELWQNFKANLASVVGEILALGIEWIANLIQGIRNKIADTVQAGRDLIEQVKSTIRNAVANFREIGGQLMEGLKQGIANKVQSIISSVRGAVQDAIAAAKNLLGIASPSKVFAEIGEYLDEGLAKGIEDKEKEPLQRIKDLANEIIAVVDGMNKKVNSTLAQTVEDVAYIANMDYSAAMLKAENIEEFQGLAKLRDAKIAGEGIDLSAEGWKSNDDLLREWQESLDKQTAAIQSTYKQGDRVLKQGDVGYDDRPIITQVVLDGKVVGEAAYKYSKLKARMVGA